MAFDLEEQEQIEALKAFWASWGKWIAGAVVGASVAYLGYVGWNYYQSSRNEAAAAVYAGVDAALQKGDLTALKSAEATLLTEYPKSGYAARSALLAAKLAFEKGDLAYAKQSLKFVIEQGHEPELQALAHLRMAAILLDEKKYDAAVSELAEQHPVAFDALFLDTKGDVLNAKGDAKAARDAYRAALAKLVGESPNRQFIQTKLDALGG
jgi:predicted negative regulator of RcsB-dependent stress response